jgi:type II secretory pathway pseudopilin PulG
LSRSGRAFTLIDVLVTMGVVVLLIGLLMPGLGKVRELSRQLVCRSNLRQIGLGLALYADESRDRLPYSQFIDPRRQENGVQGSPQDMMTLRRRSSFGQPAESAWDGLGLLYATEVLPSQGIFYCPSHHGRHGMDQYADTWRAPRGTLVGNYHFRGEGPNGSTRLSFIEPSRAAIAADGMQSIEDYNHRVGMNVLRADLSLFWLSDALGTIGDYIAEQNGSGGFDASSFGMLWDQLDSPEDEMLPMDGL